MTCGDKFNKNCPTGGTRVDPTETDGRPLCVYPGCGKRLLGDGRCVDGHVQARRLVLVSGRELPLAWAVREKAPYPGTRLTTTCPSCGAPMVATFEPNVSTGVSLECTARAAHSMYVPYDGITNFTELVRDRMVELGQIDFDAVDYEPDTGNHYETIGGQLYCLWSQSGQRLFEKVSGSVPADAADSGAGVLAVERAHTEARREHRRQVQARYEDYLRRKQAEFDAWKAQTLAGLERTTAFPALREVEHETQIRWPKGLRGTVSSGGTYCWTVHPQEGGYWMHFGDGGDVAYVSPAQAQRWRMNLWEQAVQAKGGAEAAWELLYSVAAYGDRPGTDIVQGIMATLGEQAVAALARQQVRRLVEPDDGTSPLSARRIAEQYGIEVRQMAAVATEPDQDDRLQMLRRVGVLGLWRDPVDGTLWGRTGYAREWVEAFPLLEQLTAVEGEMDAALGAGMTPEGITAALRALDAYPQIKPEPQNRQVLAPLWTATGSQLVRLADVPPESTRADHVTFRDGSNLEVWTVPPALRASHPHALAILHDPAPQSAAVWLLNPRGDHAPRRVAGVLFQPRQTGQGAATGVYDAAVTGATVQHQLVPRMAPGDRLIWGEPDAAQANALPYYTLERTADGFRLTTENSSPVRPPTTRRGRTGSRPVPLTEAEVQAFLAERSRRTLRVAVNADLVERSAPQSEA